MGTQIIGEFLSIECKQASIYRTDLQKKAAKISRTDTASGQSEGRDRAWRKHIADRAKDEEITMSKKDRAPNNEAKSQTKHRVFKVWHRSPCGNFWRIKLVPRRDIQLGTASDYVLEREGRPREWKCDEGIRAAMWNGIAHLNRISNVLKPILAPLPQHIEDDCVMLLMETEVPAGWAGQAVPLLLECEYLDAMSKMRIVAHSMP